MKTLETRGRQVIDADDSDDPETGSVRAVLWHPPPARWLPVQQGAWHPCDFVDIAPQTIHVVPVAARVGLIAPREVAKLHCGQIHQCSHPKVVSKDHPPPVVQGSWHDFQVLFFVLALHKYLSHTWKSAIRAVSAWSFAPMHLTGRPWWARSMGLFKLRSLQVDCKDCKCVFAHTICDTWSKIAIFKQISHFDTFQLPEWKSLTFPRCHYHIPLLVCVSNISICLYVFGICVLPFCHFIGYDKYGCTNKRSNQLKLSYTAQISWYIMLSPEAIWGLQ